MVTVNEKAIEYGEEYAYTDVFKNIDDGSKIKTNIDIDSKQVGSYYLKATITNIKEENAWTSKK